jgi:diguanylate cyclase (GGDEF)-like protein/PAS domain S-box-containing protein
VFSLRIPKCKISSSKFCQTIARLGMFFLGAILLSVFSFFQKRLLGIEITLDIRAFTMPVLIGGACGLLISNFLIRLSIANFKLSQSQSHLQDFMDNASDLIQSISPEGKILYTNRTWQETLGYNPEELATLNIFDIIAPESRPHCQTELQAVLGGKTTHASFALIAKKGNRVYVDGMINCKFENGKPVSTRGVLRNVTQSREAGEKLRLAAKVYEHVNDGIFVTDQTGKFLTTNQAFTSITGYCQDEMIGKRPNTFILAEDNQQQFIQELHGALWAMRNWQGEFIARRKNRNRFSAFMKITTVKGDDGNPLNYIGVLTDITSRKETEERLRHLATHDILTNLPNRMLFVDRLQRAVWYAEQTGKKLAVLYIDLDGFKEINDTYGHGQGDAFLKVIAQRLLETVSGNTIARFGGDEFSILLEQIDSESDAFRMARKILKVLAIPVQVEKNELSATASIGISIFPNCPNPNSLLSKADTAMYKAKSKGKNTVAFLS